MKWLTKSLLLVENYKRRKSLQQRISETEKQINKILSKPLVYSWHYKQVEALKLRIIELQRDLIELEYKEPEINLVKKEN